MSEAIERWSGWLVSVWCGFVGCLPSASKCLIYVSIAVGVAQFILSIFKAIDWIKFRRRRLSGK